MKTLFVGLIAALIFSGCASSETEENCNGTWVKAHDRNGSHVKAHCRETN